MSTLAPTANRAAAVGASVNTLLRGPRLVWAALLVPPHPVGQHSDRCDSLPVSRILLRRRPPLRRIIANTPGTGSPLLSRSDRMYGRALVRRRGTWSRGLTDAHRGGSHPDRGAHSDRPGCRDHWHLIAAASMFIGHARVRRASAALAVLVVVAASLFARLIIEWSWWRRSLLAEPPGEERRR
jgi:hypothetical protein